MKLFKLIFNIILTIIITSNSYAQIKIVQEIENKTSDTFENLMVHKDNKGNNYLILFSQNNKLGKRTISIYDNNFKLVLIKSFTEYFLLTSYASGSQKSHFARDNFHIVGENTVYKIDINSMKIDSMKLNHDLYNNRFVRYAYYDNYKGEEVLIYDNLTTVDIYSIKPNFLLIKSFDKEFEDKGYVVKPFVVNENIVYTTKKNELICRNISTKKEIWRYNTGTEKVKLLGITVANAEDYISQYLLVEEDKNFNFIINTSAGDLIKIDAQTGKELIKKDKFTGIEEFSKAWHGKLTFISQYDMNNDEILDFPSVSADKSVYCINGKDLSILWNYKTDGWLGFLSLYDITGDSIPEIFTLNSSGELIILNGKNGSKISKIKNSNSDRCIGPILCDFDGNKKLNLIALHSSKKVIIYEMDNCIVDKNKIIVIK